MSPYTQPAHSSASHRTSSPYLSGSIYGLLISGLAIVALCTGVTCTSVAGDLLRGGYNPFKPGATNPGSFTPPAALVERKNAQDVLARTTRAIAAVNAMQSAARQIAIGNGINNLGINPNSSTKSTLPDVPNGLLPGGLVPSTTVTWTGIENGKPTQSTTSGGQTLVDIVQNLPDAVLTWNSFNIGKQTTLNFDQSKGGADESKWIAFNIIQDPSGNPSQILGDIKAGGQVYVINQNGIIFGGSSLVNVHTLVASSLPINTNLISRGLLNNPDSQFLFSDLPIPSGPNGTPVFTPPAALTASGADGNVTVLPGASITAPANASNVGGRVMLVGPNVYNQGTISTPDGQTILAAGLQVGAVASSDPTLRGLKIYIGSVSDANNPTAGIASNTGSIQVPYGDAYMVGKTVDQMGDITSTTSVTLNGRIDLYSQYDSLSGDGAVGVNPFLPQSSGAVVLGPDSVSSILPDLASASTVVGTSLALQPEVNFQGDTIHMEADSTLLAPGASVSLDAGTWFYQSFGAKAISTFVNTTGQIYLDANAVINSAGVTDIQVPVSQNIISAQLLGPQLADSPSQRNGPFRGQTINVDIRNTGVYNGIDWVGTPLADISGYVGLIEYTVGELSINGGPVSLNAGGSIVMQPGSMVNVSGGYINYQGGVVSTSEVISNGHIYPISQAYPNLVYQGFNLGTFSVDHPKYALSNTYTDPLLDVSHYENSYVNGGNGGALSITAPAVALDGQLVGLTSPGPRQRSILPGAPNSLATSSLPTPSSLSLSFQNQANNAPNFTPQSPFQPHVIFSTADNLPAVGPFAVDGSGNPLALSAAREDTVILSPDLFTTSGFGSLQLDNGDGNVTLPANTSLTLGPDGSLSISAANVDIEGAITAPGGSLSFSVYDFSPYAAAGNAIPPIDPSRGHFTLGSGASLDTAGLILNDSHLAPNPDVLPLITNGGSVSINSFSADLKSGSVINVSGGVEITEPGTPAYGNGGSISITTGQDPLVTSLIGGTLTLGSDLQGYSGATGGTLAVQAPLVQVGGVALHPDTLLLDPAFFDQGGFSSFSIAGLGAATATPFDFIPAVYIAPGTQLDPFITSLIAMTDPSSGDVQLVKSVLNVGVRSPVSLKFRAPGVSTQFSANPLLIRGDILMAAGSDIRTDPRANVTFNGQTVAILGSVDAPSGSITISGGKDSTALFSASGIAPTVDIGPHSVLSTAGVTVLTANAYGYRTGNVLNGGSISLAGDIVAEAGAILNVSGASSTLDETPVQANVNASLGGAPDAVQPGSFLGQVLVPTVVDSNGGSITMAGAQELFSDATLIGAPGGPSALGGSLTLSSGIASQGGQTPLQVTLNVTQSGPTFKTGYYPSGKDAIGRVVVNGNGAILAPMGYFAANAFNSAGFDSLNLLGTVQFSGPVSISAPGSISVATAGVIYADASVTLSANSVTLGQPFIPPTQPSLVQPPYLVGSSAFNFAPTFGSGSLTVTANLINIGYLSLQDIGSARFIAANGDIRGDGTLDIAGNLVMQAGQIYVPTEVNFTIAAYNYVDNGVNKDGSVTFLADGVRDLPLSAGGSLDVYATNIDQDGVLRAPLGAITLGWDGSGTAPVDIITGLAVNATQTLTLGSSSVTSVSAIDPRTGQALIIPYGTNPNGTAWIDPSGVDITAGGVPQKSISISAVNVNDEHGAVIDIKGGGDLLAYQFLPGIGGNVDILGALTSFAILPGYQPSYAPYDAVPGYTNLSLVAGDQIYLNASASLPAGDYTLLPARYALLPGAFLVTPQSSNPVGASQLLPDGGSLVSGYRFSPGQSAAPLTTSFEVDSTAVLNTLAPYTRYSGDSFLAAGAVQNSQKVPRLPRDSGQLEFQALDSLAIAGVVQSTAQPGGLGGLVDIASPDNILITGATAITPPPNTLVLSASELDSFAAASLLIGGTRQTTSTGLAITVTTPDITVDNSGDPLTGSDIILACNNILTVSPDAVITGAGSSTGAQPLAITGNGALLRISSDPAATVTRTGVTTASTPSLIVGAGARITGASITLDSSSKTSLDPTAIIQGQSVALNSGQITIELTNPGAITPTSGLVLSGVALQTLFGSAHSISLLSYNSLDIYGSGQLGALDKNGQPVLQNLSLSAGEIRAYNTGGAAVTFDAANISLGNTSSGVDPGATAGASGALILNADTVDLGANSLAIDQFTALNINASSGIIADSPSGAISVQGAVTLTTPLITGVAGAVEQFTATGNLLIASPAKAGAAPVGGLGASLTFTGASLTDNSAIIAQSGLITLQASTGSLSLGNLAATSLDVTGQAKTFFNATRYSDAGQINLIANQGSVSIGAKTAINLSADSAGGSAGALSVSDPNGTLTLANPTLSANAGPGGHSGSFSLDVGSLSSLSALDMALNTGGFDQSRSFEVQTGDVTVDGLATAANFSLAADGGSITVSGQINASGQTGGAIALQAQGSVTLLSGALLSVAAQDYSSAQKGGSVDLEAGSDINGVASSSASVNIDAGSTINLSVANPNPVQGDLSGTLLIRAPQIGSQSAPTGIQVNPIAGDIIGASRVTVEGYQIYNASAAGSIDNQEAAVFANGAAFTSLTSSLTTSLVGGNSALQSAITSGATQLVILPGAEIINPTGDLTLASNWDLSTYRFGPDSVAGDLTLRAAGNITLKAGASLSDGFDPTQSPDGKLWDAPLLSTVGAPSWSYRIVSGASFSGANYAGVTPISSLAANEGSLLLGLGANQLPTSKAGKTSLIPANFQTIRTGAGSISVVAGRDVQLLNNLATIYSAGTQAPALADFLLPSAYYDNSPLGKAPENFYPAQYTEYGGSVSVVAQGDIAHYVRNIHGQLVIDSSLELPDNWLNRQGAINPATGLMDSESTSWWINFSNFFDGVASFGGGNVTLSAGNNIINVDASIATNAAMPNGVPNAAALQELGGGDLLVRAGNNISGGAYYVERGTGTLSAGGQILTNTARSTITQSQANSSGGTVNSNPQTWLPTALFAGNASFNVSASGNITLGPVANPFLLPQSIYNSYYDRSFFSTYATTDQLNVTSLSGNINVKDAPDFAGSGSLGAWLNNIDAQYANSFSYAATSQPWLALAQPSTGYFNTVAALMPGTLRVSAFSGAINLLGGILLSPSPSGTVDLLAATSINGFQINEYQNAWGSSVINLSDANPASVPGITTPIYGDFDPVSSSNPLQDINTLFAETGSTQGAAGTIETRTALHAPGLLHKADSTPARLFAGSGDISGLTFYSPKFADIIAGQDITDTSFYIQNDSPSNITIISAGRDIIPYDPNSPLHILSAQPGNSLIGVLTPITASTVLATVAPGDPNSGDIQISGPGSLEVLAGRNLTLGSGNPYPGGLADGITSIGNARNPYLPFTGAQVVAAAGLGGISVGLDQSPLDISAFVTAALSGPNGATYFADLAADEPGLGVSSLAQYKKLSAAQQAIAALDLFYLVLRDAGRNHNLFGNPGYGTYTAGFAAVQALLPSSHIGNIDLTSKEIKTESGGNIDILDPAGQLTVGVELAGAQPVDQGILTQDGGNISIYTKGDVNIGTSRIFTLHGGNIIIWSNAGNIAAGESSKTVQSAPPTRVLFDPQSADVETDLAGLATGGGIGVLATLVGVPPGNVDLIAPTGVIDAGDAGIRATGNLNLAAVQILNASNIQAGGATSGVPTVTVAAPNLGSLAAASSAAGATNQAADQQANNPGASQASDTSPDSIIDVTVLGYGGGDNSADDGG